MSSVFDYFYDGIVDTYNETVDYWSKDGAMSDAVDAVSWSIENPDVVAEATKKGLDKSMSELSTAVNQDKNKLILILAAAGAAYFYFFKRKK